MTSTKTVKNASPATELNTDIQADYALVLNARENSNSVAFDFLASIASTLSSKASTQAVIEASMKAEAKGAKITADFKPAHVKSATVAQAIVTRFPEVIESPIGKVLTLANRVLDDKKASKAIAHINAQESLEALNENTLTKAESQARDKGEKVEVDITESAKAITLESIVDAVDTYLNATDLKTLTTSELEKLHKVIAKLITVEKNTKALA